ncbi:MAG: protoheme IX farnesyltransferase [Gammaproteobacteria bacterium]|jgi:heme o synthase|nr:protoheme IX farnesyltransferase [Gammaproteobacteria bacterium]MBT5406603.1 protoheme IX farnesyltransferase [Gammaproteobacteria bacterium]MBT5644401.1 protoheme IX farnesyltransferase [Gammaproteobacteria bacterium]MBT5862922.1 protoheme IX farnesyltransferase [Gammaproteobacteria bacterium]MBT6734388.1 protoheme IX farnesyltransferase [Gammaproteobacteria bacterium]
MRNSSTYNQNSFLNILREFIILTKPRVNLLIMFTAIVGMLLAHQDSLNYELILFSSLGIGLAASAAAIINHVVDQKIDSIMDRTKSRPLVNGSIKPLHAIYFALFLSVTSITMLYVFVNTLTALLTLLSIIIYSVIYSVYLKNLTSQNIVIGGIAGAMPPLLGWTSITNQIEPFPLVLFLIIFLWTPPHFWALAVYKYEDYKKADIPMLPVTHGRDFARLHIFLYSILLFCITLFPYILGLSGFIYLTGVVLIGLKFVLDSYMLMVSKSASEAIALFKYSITYLAVLFALLLFDHFWYLSSS